MVHPCQTGYQCMWGRNESEERIVCSVPQCALVKTSGVPVGFRFDKLRRKMVKVKQ